MNPLPEWRGKLAVVTGATSGIGRAVAIGLASKGLNLILIGRNESRARRILKQIEAVNSDGFAQFMRCDLSDQRQVRELAQAIKASAKRVDILVNNAHARFQSFQASADGVEMTFATTYLSHFLLTALLLDSLLAAPEARIINVAGDSYKWSDGDFERCLRPSDFDRKVALYTSKLGNVLFTVELARRLHNTNIVVNAVHPGIVATRAGSGGRLIPLLKHYVYYGLKGMLVSPRQGADPVIHLATAPEMRAVTGTYFNGKFAEELSSAAQSRELVQRLWATSLRLTHLVAEMGESWTYFRP